MNQRRAVQESSTQRWCLGVPQTAERVLSEAEVLELRKARHGLVPRAAAWFLAGVLGPPVLALAGLLLGFDWLWRGLSVLAFAGWSVGAYQAWKRGRQSWLLRQEVADPRVARFSAVLELDAAIWLGRVLRLRDAPQPGPFEFEVNLGSGRLRSANGWLQPRLVLLHVESVAPKRPSDLADPERPERALSAEECAELRRHALRAWSPYLLPMAVFLFAGVLELVRQRTLPAVDRWWQQLSQATWAATLVLFGWVLFRNWQRSSRLRADAASGRVLRAEIGVGAQHAAAEVLAASRTFWTIAGKPAAWRTGGARLRRG